MSCSFDPSHYTRNLADLRRITRRQFFSDCGVGIGKAALASLLAGGISKAFASPGEIINPTLPKPPPFKAKAKHVIYMFMVGAPSQLELFDYKPTLVKYDGQPVPAHIVQDQRYAFIEKNAALMSPRYKFKKHGQSGQEISEILPHTATVADDICIIRSMYSEQFNHAPAQIFLNTGTAQLGRPSMGSWISSGLGSESPDLPAFVVLSSGAPGASGGASLWSCGFLPTVHQGVNFRAKGHPILAVANPKGIDPRMQRESLDLVRNLNEHHLANVGDPEIQTRISAYELAYRMQTSAPELIDLSGESKETLEMYGAKPGESSFANNCLLAPRLIEHGRRLAIGYQPDWAL